jgi:hypothetical protein
MAGQWLRGTVKAVPSGDSLLIMGNQKVGPPPEKTITLASIIAPKLVRVSCFCGILCEKRAGIGWLDTVPFMIWNSLAVMESSRCTD